MVAGLSAAEQGSSPSLPPSGLLLLCVPAGAQKGGPPCWHAVPTDAPSGPSPHARNLPSLAVTLGGWGLLSSGKLLAASLPGSLCGWDPSESHCGGEGKSHENIWSGGGGGWEEGFQMGLQDSTSGKVLQPGSGELSSLSCPRAGWGPCLSPCPSPGLSSLTGTQCSSSNTVRFLP